MTVKIPIARVQGAGADADVPLPEYATSGSAGMDLRAVIGSPVVIDPGARALVSCGIMIAIPAGYEGQVRARSGLAVKHGIGVLNAPGTIDSDYRGEVKVILANFGGEPFTVNRGDRIAQLVIAPVARAQWEETPELAGTGRGAGGFGHTGK
jgi:dUTP pyrophosphatase